MSHPRQRLAWPGLVFIFLGYLTVWLPGPGAGLSLIGLELSEWSKFLPEVQSGDVGPRLWFSLPPISLGLMLALWSTGWPERRWQTWAARGLAIVLALMALPPLDVIRDEAVTVWIIPVAFVMLVGLAGIGAFALGRSAPSLREPIRDGLLLFVALIGLALPTIVFLELRPLVSHLLGVPLGVGLGVWLNAAGHLLSLAAAVFPYITKETRFRAGGRETERHAGIY